MDIMSKDGSKVCQAIINLNLTSDLNLESLPFEQNQNFPIIYDKTNYQEPSENVQRKPDVNQEDNDQSFTYDVIKLK